MNNIIFSKSIYYAPAVKSIAIDTTRFCDPSNPNPEEQDVLE